MGSTTPTSPKVWATLITKTSYLPGLLALAHSLKASSTKYPLVALYTDEFPASGRAALTRRNIPLRRVEYVLPAKSKVYATDNDPRFADTWTKLAAFALLEYERVVLLDSDMVVLRNMDELMDVPLDPASLNGEGHRVFAASHACACNPLKKAHYPDTWVPANCAFTTQHGDAERAQVEGAPATAGVGMLNSGLLVIVPSRAVHDKIAAGLAEDRIAKYDFPDQQLLSDVFLGRWAPLPYVYNALKTLRGGDVHGVLWRDGEVRNVHYILSPKPWDVEREGVTEETMKWWWRINDERVKAEKDAGISDDFQ